MKALKDRPGWHQRGEGRRIGEFAIDLEGERRWELTLNRGAAGGEQPDRWRPTFLMQRVSEYLEEAGEGRSRTRVRSEVKGNEKSVLEALDELVKGGFAKAEEGRQRGTNIYLFERRFVYEPGHDRGQAEAGDPGQAGPRSRVNATQHGERDLGDPGQAGPKPGHGSSHESGQVALPPQGGAMPEWPGSNGVSATPSEEDLERYERLAGMAGGAESAELLSAGSGAPPSGLDRCGRCGKRYDRTEPGEAVCRCDKSDAPGRLRAREGGAGGRR